MLERSDRMWSTGEGNGKPLQYSCLENPVNRMKRQNDRILKVELPRSVGAQYATGDPWRNNSRKNEGMEPKQNNTQLCMLPVIEARSDAVKTCLPSSRPHSEGSSYINSFSPHSNPISKHYDCLHFIK